MHTKKIIYRHCLCGEDNTVYTGYTVHNRMEFCKICNELSFKQGFQFNVLRWLIDTKEEYFEEFAIAWG